MTVFTKPRKHGNLFTGRVPELSFCATLGQNIGKLCPCELCLSQTCIWTTKIIQEHNFLQEKTLTKSYEYGKITLEI